MWSRRKWALLALLAALLAVSSWRIVFPLREEWSSLKTNNDFAMLGLGMHGYAEKHGHLPGANAPCEEPAGNGKKHPLSWRVLLLPYIEEQALHDQYKFDEPWDGPNNILLIDKIPKFYRHPKADHVKLAIGYTHYRVFGSRPAIKPSALFTDGMPGPKLKEIPDGTTDTIMIVEASEAVPWTMPEILLYERNQPLPKLGGLFKSHFFVATAAGSSGNPRLSYDISEDKLRALITKDGGEPAGWE